MGWWMNTGDWAPALAEDMTLDDPFAEMTAPAKAGNIMKGDEGSPQPTDLQDVFESICTYRSFLSGVWLQNQIPDWFQRQNPIAPSSCLCFGPLLASFGQLCSAKECL